MRFQVPQGLSGFYQNQIVPARAAQGLLLPRTVRALHERQQPMGDADARRMEYLTITKYLGSPWALRKRNNDVRLYMITGSPASTGSGKSSPATCFSSASSFSIAALSSASVIGANCSTCEWLATSWCMPGIGLASGV